MLYHFIQAIQHPENDLRFQSIVVDAASVDEAYEIGGREAPLLNLKPGERTNDWVLPAEAAAPLETRRQKV